jgi:hypothetical protein
LKIENALGEIRNARFLAQELFMNRFSCTLKVHLGLTAVFLVQSYLCAKEIITPDLIEVLNITGITHDGTLPSIVDATQKAWLRPTGVERWEMDGKYQELSPIISPYFKQLGMIDEIVPTKKEYTYCIVLGATVTAVRKRLSAALDFWKRGIRFKKLVFLVGARPLAPEKESEATLYHNDNKYLPIKAHWVKPATTPKTETEMARMVFDQAELPHGFTEAVEVVFVDTPMQKLADGTERRPNTGDTVRQWITDTEVIPGSVLALSSQPYIRYQDTVLRTLLPKTFTSETVGPKKSGNESVDVMLDNLARWLSEELNYEQSCKHALQ